MPLDGEAMPDDYGWVMPLQPATSSAIVAARPVVTRVIAILLGLVSRVR
jgi:hypothetical protein